MIIVSFICRHGMLISPIGVCCTTLLHYICFIDVFWPRSAFVGCWLYFTITLHNATMVWNNMSLLLRHKPLISVVQIWWLYERWWKFERALFSVLNFNYEQLSLFLCAIARDGVVRSPCGSLIESKTVWFTNN